MLERLPLQSDPRLLVGRETSDDAGVVKLTDEIALVQTVDFFTPIVNDPYDFGRVAAANAFSDVYAMGGTPLTAMNLVGFPIKKRDPEELLRILQGGLEVTRQAGALLVGGHSVDDPEVKYGLSVTGVVHPERIVTNANARPGDALVLTKPLGTGVLATAIKMKKIGPENERRLVETMAALNDRAAQAMVAAGVRAATDITGFGLIGHGLEMARASGVTLVLEAGRVPLLDDVRELAARGLLSGGAGKTRAFCGQALVVDPGAPEELVAVMADAQTSGGLFMAVPQGKLVDLLADLSARGVMAAVVGRVGDEAAGRVRVTP